MTMHRRHFLAMAPGIALAGCGTLSQQQAMQSQQLVAGAQALENSLVSFIPIFLASPLISLSPAQISILRGAMAGVVTATNALAQAPSLSAGTAQVQAIETALNTIVVVASTIPVIPEPYHTDLVLAALALPPLEALVGLVVQQGTALARTIAAKAVKGAA